MTSLLDYLNKINMPAAYNEVWGGNASGLAFLRFPKNVKIGKQDNKLQELHTEYLLLLMALSQKPGISFQTFYLDGIEHFGFGDHGPMMDVYRKMLEYFSEAGIVSSESDKSRHPYKTRFSFNTDGAKNIEVVSVTPESVANETTFRKYFPRP